jgi:hypothetical protein
VFHQTAGKPAEQLLAFAKSVVPRVNALHGTSALVSGGTAGG